MKSNPIKKVFNSIVSNMSFLGAVWIVMIMLVIVADVLCRNLLGKPLAGTPEIVKNSIVGITFLQLAHVLREGRHIRSTVFLDRLSPKGKAAVEVFSHILGMVVSGLLFYAEWTPAWDAWRSGDYEGEGSLQIPTYPTHFLILIGSFLMFSQFAVLCFNHVRTLLIPWKFVKILAFYNNRSSSKEV